MPAAPRALEAEGEMPHSRAMSYTHRADSPPLTMAHYGNRNSTVSRLAGRRLIRTPRSRLI